MKKIILTLMVMGLVLTDLQAQEFKVITSVESIVPNGIGRSRIINTLDEKDYRDFTSVQSEESGDRNRSDRGEIRVKDYEETKLLNFYNIGGIRFQNIAANDTMITSMINSMISDGWELAFVTSAVESAGKADNQGIFITRYIFRK